MLPLCLGLMPSLSHAPSLGLMQTGHEGKAKKTSGGSLGSEHATSGFSGVWTVIVAF